MYIDTYIGTCIDEIDQNSAIEFMDTEDDADNSKTVSNENVDDMANPKVGSDEDERRKTLLNGIHRLFLNFQSQVETHQMNSPDDLRSLIDAYEYLYNGIPVFARLDGAKDLASLQIKTKQRKINKSDKQIRLTGKPKAGRKPKPKDLRIPDSPEKRKLEAELLKTLTKKKQQPKKLTSKKQLLKKNQLKRPSNKNLQKRKKSAINFVTQFTSLL